MSMAPLLWSRTFLTLGALRVNGKRSTWACVPAQPRLGGDDIPDMDRPDPPIRLADGRGPIEICALEVREIHVGADLCGASVQQTSDRPEVLGSEERPVLQGREVALVASQEDRRRKRA